MILTENARLPKGTKIRFIKNESTNRICIGIVATLCADYLGDGNVEITFPSPWFKGEPAHELTTVENHAGPRFEIVAARFGFKEWIKRIERKES